MTSKKCDSAICTNASTFEGSECAGSEEDEHQATHHCVDCGQLWSDEKGLSCALCSEYWCPDWQSTFVLLNCLNSWSRNKMYDQFVCSYCFLENSIFWCREENCKCRQKRAIVQKSWNLWRQKDNPMQLR